MTPTREKKIKEVINRRRQAVVVLEDIHDPHNAAAVMRSCEAFGVYKVCFIFEKEKRYNPKRVGKISSASANKWLEIEVFSSTKECFLKLKKKGYKIIVTALDEKAVGLDKVSLENPKIALVFGNEHRGVSEQAIKLANETVYIPMQGMVQSLNISVTAAICIYEMWSRQSKKMAKNKAFLSKTERTKLLKKWLD